MPGVVTVPSTLLRLSGDETIPATEADLASGALAARPIAYGRYDLVGVLGEGGMGRVDHVRDRDLLRDVAAKHLLPRHHGDRTLVDQFLWEARVTAFLDHPNIIPVHELGHSPDGQLFFTMKLARGATLEDAIAGARKHDETGDDAIARRLRTFLKVCDAMAFAHAKGVLHRDLKPANILVGGFGEVLVSDWGLAVPLDVDASDELRRIVPAELSKRSAGTPVYMSPEQARGDALDARSDVYTLGAILYELVSLRRPIEGQSLVEVLANVMSGEVVPLEQARPGVSSALSAVVGKAMALAPDDRYATASDLAEDVQTFLDGLTPHAEKARPGSRVSACATSTGSWRRRASSAARSRRSSRGGSPDGGGS